MVLPIAVYGNPVLKKIAQNIDKTYPELNKLIENMWETMYKSDGVGLAAPQVNASIRLFLVDASPMEEDDPSVKDFKQVFINAYITERLGEEKLYNEGCLSVPNLREDVKRYTKIRMKYCDENFVEHDNYFEGTQAWIIQHEYDHLEGVLFVEHLSALRRRLIKARLTAISVGKFEAKYKVIRNIIK